MEDVVWEYEFKLFEVVAGRHARVIVYRVPRPRPLEIGDLLAIPIWLYYLQRNQPRLTDLCA
jgi:hypothetical protein